MKKGDQLQVNATVQKVKNDVPTVLEIEGKRYVYEPKTQRK
ncbi:hypothetical protein [Halobacillus sp. BBL2006]|nr:hypothetical protein [Halobacillus sp. BBL2006]